MTDVKTVQGITNVYPSKEAVEFKQADHYPIAWEVIYINDKVGKEFTDKLLQSINNLPKEAGYLLDLQGESSDVARCAECVFASKDAFRSTLQTALQDLVIYDEEQKGIKPKQQLLEAADKIINQGLAVV